MTDVFISYSRTDKPFVEKLHDALTKHRKSLWLDWKDIPDSAEWRAEIQDGIEKADNIVFVLSPDFLGSFECMMELEFSEEFNKRLIPIVYRDPDDDQQIPPSLASLNWIFFRDTDDFDEAIKKLLDAMATDLDWVKMHTRLTDRALEWEEKERNESYLLRGDDLAEAIQHLSQRNREPALTQFQHEYIVASQQEQAADLKRELKQAGQLRRRLWIAIGLLATVLIVGIFAIFLAIKNGTLLMGAAEIVDSMVAFSDAQANADVCWGGALQGLEQAVMPACDRAIELNPEFSYYYESRGLTNALLEHYPAAIVDFKTAIELAREFNDGQDRISMWEEWVQQLEQENNPFNEALIQELLSDWMAEKAEYNE